MAFPKILVDSATGSDTAASGAGPSTALTGAAASTNSGGTVVTLDGSPDLTGVATDGSHAIYLADATSGHRNFAKITAKDNGAKTVTVAEAFTGSLTGKAWAIGGKRASCFAGTSLLLFTQPSNANGDAMPGWVIEMQSGHAESTGQVPWPRHGDATSGAITLQGVSGAATMPIVTFTNDGAAFDDGGHVFQDFEVRNSNASKTASCFLTTYSNNGACLVRRIRCTHATNKFAWFWIGSNVSSVFRIRSCEIANCAVGGIYLHCDSGGKGGLVQNCYIHDITGVGIHIPKLYASKAVVYGNIVDTCTGRGISCDPGGGDGGFLVVAHNTVYGCGGDGFYFSDAGLTVVVAFNNLSANNTGYGFNIPTAVSIAEYKPQFSNNATYGNSSGGFSNSGTDENPQTSDPGFTDAPNGDFTIGTNLKALGFPTLPIGT